VYSLIKRVSVKNLIQYTWTAVKMTGKMYPMIVAGSFFGRFIALSRLPSMFTEWIVQMNINRFWLFTMVIVLYIICGCMMDVMSIIIITIPVVFPMLTALGFSGPCLCVVLVLMTGIAGATPPVGNGVFMLASVADCEPYDIFKRVWPYVLGLTVAAYVIAFCPNIVEFLANIMA
jgi:TRAP-type C4-dicarboxylate transport system permease large subunit